MLKIFKNFTYFYKNRISLRILAIMIIPLALFLVGLFSLDQYRLVLVKTELDALERQAITLARSLALAETEKNKIINYPLSKGIKKLFPLFSRPQMSSETMNHLLPLVGYGAKSRAMVFQPSGYLLADTFKHGFSKQITKIEKKETIAVRNQLKIKIVNIINKLAIFFNNRDPMPIINVREITKGKHFSNVKSALDGKITRGVWADIDGNLVLTVSVPIQDLKIVRGALFLSTSGGKIENEIANVQWVFLKLFISLLIVTIALGLFLSRSITRPIAQLALFANQIKNNNDEQKKLITFPKRHDEIGQLSRAFLDMTSELQNRIKATGKFAADVSHELKNPLTSLKSAIETFSKTKNLYQQNRLLKIIFSDIERINKLITDISQTSRMDFEFSNVKPEEQNLNKLITNWVKSSRIRYKNIKFIWEQSKENYILKIHTSRILQILDNLLNNAVSFSKNDTLIKITLKKKNKYVVLSFIDNGPGIRDGEEEKIFERFYSERPTGQGFEIHSGLGLSIARQIAEAHGGKLSVKNLFEGAEFLLTLPISK